MSKIPVGRVLTYADIAKKAGSPRAVRAVGNILNKNTDFERVPCHRVVRSDGSVGGYVKGGAAKVRKLLSEGVVIEKGKVDLSLCRMSIV